MYHPYLNGYSVLPDLHKLGDEPIFQVDDQLDYYLQVKRDVIHNPYHEVDVDYDALNGICRWMNDQIAPIHPNFKPSFGLTEIAMQIQEDVVIHKITKDDDWMMACHVSLPGGWCPQEKIGKSFVDIHEPVPGMKSSYALAKAMLKGPFYRFVWGVRFDRELNSHPGVPRQEFPGSGVYVKVERQVVYPFPQWEAVLFLIRLHFVEPDMPALKKAVLGMTPDQWNYKGFSPEFIQWCSSSQQTG